MADATKETGLRLPLAGGVLLATFRCMCPNVAISSEDAIAQEIFHCCTKGCSLGKVLEVRLQDVLLFGQRLRGGKTYRMNLGGGGGNVLQSVLSKTTFGGLRNWGWSGRCLFLLREMTESRQKRGGKTYRRWGVQKRFWGGVFGSEQKRPGAAARICPRKSPPKSKKSYCHQGIVGKTRRATCSAGPFCLPFDRKLLHN